jgi:glutamate racemase
MESIRPAVDYFKEKKVDNIILGCTHFLFLDKYFRMMVPPSVSIIDSREGVSNQALKVLGCAPETDRENCSDSFFVTSEEDSAENYRFFSDYFNLKYSGILA